MDTDSQVLTQSSLHSKSVKARRKLLIEVVVSFNFMSYLRLLYAS